MTTSHPSIITPGEGSNLGRNFLFRVNNKLPHFKTDIPFNQQGSPIPDFQQHHAGKKEINAMTYNERLSTLPYYHFFGTSFPQINQPDFMSVVDKR